MILRWVLGQPDALESPDDIEDGVASTLTRLECLRALDRLRLDHEVDPAELSIRRKAVYDLTDTIRLIEPDAAVLDRAAQPFPTPLGTLDAVHLAGAILYQAQEEEELQMATHDRRLGIAAAAMGLEVIGVDVSPRS